jgi:hypothetical protein
MFLLCASGAGYLKRGAFEARQRARFARPEVNKGFASVRCCPGVRALSDIVKRRSLRVPALMQIEGGSHTPGAPGVYSSLYDPKGLCRAENPSGVHAGAA